MTTSEPTGTRSEPDGTRTAPGTARLVLRRPSAVVALAWLAVTVIGSVAATWIAPYPRNGQDLTLTLAGPSSAHWLGTDALGRDVLSRLLFGGGLTLAGVLIAVLTWLLIGVTTGVLAGYAGGWFDRLTSRLVDITLAIPGLIILLVVLAVFGNNMSAAMLTFGVLASAGLVRVIRASTLVIRNDLYVSAARVSGLRPDQILLRHILPRITTVIVVQASLFAGVALAVQAGLAFLGFGPQPPDPSWGGMVGEAAQVINRSQWMLVPTGGTIVATIVAFGVLGDAIRDASASRWSATRLPARRQPSAPPSSGGATDPHTASGGATDPHTASGGRAPDPQALLSVRGLTIELNLPQGPTQVVSDVSFDVTAGEALGVVGESGCGKTMTALGILGLLPPRGRIAAGSITFAGQDLTKLPREELARIRGSQIAYVSQEPMVALDPTHTVGSHLVEAVRRHRGLPRREARTIAIGLLESVGLPDPESVAGRYPFQLSGGMAQRAAIALALAGEPKLLIADEPTTALDVTVQGEILALLHQLQDEAGLAVVIVTHNLGVIADLCDRAAVMYCGQVVELGEFADMYAAPAHPYTRALLGTYPGATVPHDPDDAGAGVGPADTVAVTQRTRLAVIEGTVPPIGAWPSGCRFQPRCPHAGDSCLRPVGMTAAGARTEARCVFAEPAPPARIAEPAPPARTMAPSGDDRERGGEA